MDIIISTIVENKPGVLHRTSNVFRQRGYNISSISVGQLEDPQLSRMTFVVEADDNAIPQLTRQLSKQVDVIYVQILNSNSIKRELALIKINAANEKQKSEIQSLCNIYKGSIVDTSPNSVMVEITNSHDKIDEFIKVAGRIGIKEISRTGVAALVKG